MPPDVDPGLQTLAQTYAFGAAPAAQTLVLLDAKGGTVVLDGSGLTSAFPYTLSVLGNAKFGGGVTVHAVQVLIGASPYAVSQTDYYLEVQSNGGAITVNLPALTGGTVPNGRIIVVGDSGYNAAVSNITVVRGNVADKINNVAASFVQVVSGSVLQLKANTTTNNWEIT